MGLVSADLGQETDKHRHSHIFAFLEHHFLPRGATATLKTSRFNLDIAILLPIVRPSTICLPPTVCFRFCLSSRPPSIAGFAGFGLYKKCTHNRTF